MDFTFTDEQRMMAGALRELTDDTCSGAQIRAAFEGGGPLDEVRWRRLSEMALTGMLAGEAHGGMGLGAIDFVLIAEEAGRACLPEPLVEHAGVAVPLLEELSGHARGAALLPRAASGDECVAVAHPCNPFALIAPQARAVIVCRDDEVHLFDRAELELTAEPSIDALRHLFKVTAPFAASSLIARGEAAAAAVQRALQRGTVFTAAQCLGLAERMIHIAVEYAKQRVQFGKPIGSYQAIKHHLATAQVKLEFARPVVYAAAARVADLDARAVAAASHAKLAAFDAAELAARSAFQVHGAMGYSWEVDLHFYMKRAWALGGVWSSRGSLGRGIQSLLLSGELDIGPDTTFMRGK